MKKLLFEDYLNTLTEEERTAFLKEDAESDDELVGHILAYCGISEKEVDAKFANTPTIEEYLGV